MHSIKGSAPSLLVPDLPPPSQDQTDAANIARRRRFVKRGATRGTLWAQDRAGVAFLQQTCILT